MAIYTNSYIGDLINAGGDAQSNLFRVTFTFQEHLGGRSYNGGEVVGYYDNYFTIRTKNVGIPEKTTNTVNVDYQNMTFPILSSGTNFPHEFTVSFRVDKYYTLYQMLNWLLCVDDNGNFVKDTSKSFSVVVEGLTLQKSNSRYTESGNHRWEFSNVYVTSCPPISFSYDSPSPIEVQAKFIFEEMKILMYDYSVQNITLSMPDLSDLQMN